MNSLLAHNAAAPLEHAKTGGSSSGLARRDAIALFVMGVLFGLVNTLNDSASSGGIEPMAIAKNLAESGRFADPFGVATGPSAHTGPLFPFYLAAVLLIFKGAATQALVLRLGAAIVHGLEIALLPLVAETMFGEAEIGFIAGLLSIVIPCYRVLPLWDSSVSGLAVIGFCLVAARIDAQSRRGMLGLGLSWGLVLLLNPVLAIATGIWALYAARRNSWPLHHSALALASAILVCLPWTIRNYVTLGGLVPIRDNFGLELQVSNNDGAAPSIVRNTTSLEQFHPSINSRQAAEVRQRGELAYNRDKLRQATAWIQSHPIRFAELSIRRVLEYWFPRTDAGILTGFGIWIVTMLSVPGMLLAAVRRVPYGGALLAMLLLAPLPFYILQSDARYREPLLWISLLLAGYALHSAMRGIARHRLT
ncbi:MAG: hypothetical protein LAP38_07860 [Acidobacteriia bacterium]|nr:hypothetical protein [Terriglobia bacterium]